jgi:hypothetical protein
MTNIIIPNINTFDFQQLRLLPATGIQGGAYFTKFEYNNNPLYIQTCKTYTKQGLVKTGKRYYCDLMFDTTNEDIITWFEEFENKCYDLMYEKKDRWFQGSISKEDIENTFTPTLRVYKSGKFYLVRGNVKTNSSNELEFKIYDEQQNHLGKESFTSQSKIISILEISGIKFTQQKFQIEIVLKQCMIINDEIMFEGCLINTNNRPLENKDNLVKIKTKEDENTNDSNDLVKMEKYEKENEEIEENEEMEKMEKMEKMEDTHSNDEENNTKFDENDLEDLSNSINIDDKVNDDYETAEEKLQVINEKNNIIGKKESAIYEIVDDNDSLTEIDPFDDVENLPNDEKMPMKIKQPNEIYYEMYKNARLQAKEAKKKAQEAYLEAKQIKDLHLLDISDSDSDSDTDINELYK